MWAAITQISCSVLTERSKHIRLFSVQPETWGLDADNGIALSFESN